MMMQEAAGGESAASAKKTLAKVQKMLQIVSVKRNALAWKDYHETLEECLKTEASTPMKILGYRLAAKNPSCTTLETWQFLLEACVSELAGSQNASVLVHSIPALELIPLPLLLGFLISSEKEPMNKLRTVLTHEQSEVQRCAITTMAKITLETGIAITTDGLCVFPFESHEARICCQQDLWTLVIDTWKLIFHTLFAGPQKPECVGAAFAAMSMLFSKCSAINVIAFHKESSMNQSAVNDITSAIFKEAFPRVRSLLAAAQALPMKYQVDAIEWLAMLLYMMMERTGASCPGLSVPYLEIDILTSDNQHDDDDENHASTQRVRIDSLVSGLLESWICPLLDRRASLAQSTTLCRAVFLLLSHRLQEFSRIKWSTKLAHNTIAQCYYLKSTEQKMEMNHMLIRLFAWTCSGDCLAMTFRAVEAINLMERETDRRDLIFALMDCICDRVIQNREFLLLESLCAMDFFRQPQGTSKLSPRTNGSQVFRLLVQALALRMDVARGKELQIAQLIVLKAFRGVISLKATSSAVGSSRRTPPNPATSNQLCYAALLTQHFQNIIRDGSLAIRESLLFFKQELQLLLSQIAIKSVRIQLIWIAIQLASTYQVWPPETILVHLQREVRDAYASHSSLNDNDDEVASSTGSASFDDGRLGGDGVCDRQESSSLTQSLEEMGTLRATVDCLRVMTLAQPQYESQFTQLLDQAIVHARSLSSFASLGTHILESSTTKTAAAQSLYSQQIFNPFYLFTPCKNFGLLLASPSRRDQRPPHESVVVTGASDPFSLQISYYQPNIDHEDLLTLEVSCFNLTSIALSDFEIHIRTLGPIKCVDPSNDLKIRMGQGGNAASSLAPFGVLKGTKQFQLQAFAQVSFYFQVVFQETGEDGETTSIQLTNSDRFVVQLDALFRLPDSHFTTAGNFHSIWQSTPSSRVVPIQAHTAEGSGSLSLCQRLVKACNARVAIVQELVVDMPNYIHIAYMAKTRWDESIAVSIVLSALGQISNNGAATWSGVFEVRSSTATVDAFTKNPRDALHLFSSALAQLSNSSNLENASQPVNDSFVLTADTFSSSSGGGFATFGGTESSIKAQWPGAGSSGKSASPFDDPTEVRPTAATTDPWAM